MKTLSDNERALIDEVEQTFDAQIAAVVECILNGSLTGFCNMDKAEEDAIRALAEVHGVELPC